MLNTNPKTSCDASTQVEVDDISDEEIERLARLWRQKSIERTKQRNQQLLQPTIFKNESIHSEEQNKNRLKVDDDGGCMGSKDKNFERQVPF